MINSLFCGAVERQSAPVKKERITKDRIGESQTFNNSRKGMKLN